ncbi:3'(2'),5'-bisphosphate nucleotidase CysQ [Williamsia sterculiae]|uniref:3'(2'),5-bisphosphonucleoside 3'(2')-phosphohydrolase n=1 Tax=Williamsia sterculiae TaxID=1344003 RepID=A0A1N7GXQ8_9NOCA|nr:3'(2'),5'-bisphosphate nucleotidase CysQ [Williamsia sterculiae]SIS17364.1 3'(2'),5'-bisphosphate nucleotidase [Williamsia sterculiae]
MSTSAPEWTAPSSDVELASELATAAGELLVELRAGSPLSGRELGDAGDTAANDLLLARLAEARPDDAVLSEESVDDRTRLTADRVWIIDPLDGTREFRERGHDDWAVHVALWERGAGLTAGAVALPALGITYRSDGVPVPATTGLLPVTGERPRVVVSASRPPAVADTVAAAIDGEVIDLGSAGAKAMAVVRGEAAAYVHAGGQYEWDSAAPVAVAAAQGLWCTRIDGAPLAYNRPDVYLPDLVICRAELAETVLAAIRGADR